MHSPGYAALLPPEVVSYFQQHFAEVINSLVRLPLAQPREALSSWVSRAAVAQGCELGEFLEVLKLDRWGDLDVATPLLLTDELLRHSKLRPLRIAKAAIQKLHEKGLPEGSLLLDDRKAVRFRFCPFCTISEPTPYLPIDARIATSRYCRFHLCLLEDECGTCGAALTLPSCMLTAGPKAQGVGDLSTCLRCGEQIATKLPVQFRKRFLRRFERAFAQMSWSHGECVVDALRSAGMSSTCWLLEFFEVVNALHEPTMFCIEDVRAEMERKGGLERIGGRWLSECDWRRLGVPIHPRVSVMTRKYRRRLSSTGMTV